MSEPEGFFGNIFQSSDDDPLLQSDPPSADDDADAKPAEDRLFSDRSTQRNARVPSEATRKSTESRTSGHQAPSHTDISAEDEDVRTVTLTEDHDRWADQRTWGGLEQLNDAVQTGWHVIDIEPEYVESTSARGTTKNTQLRLHVELERDIPRSLFDFGLS